MTMFFQHKGDTGANKGNGALNEHNSTARMINVDRGVDLLLPPDAVPWGREVPAVGGANL